MFALFCLFGLFALLVFLVLFGLVAHFVLVALFCLLALLALLCLFPVLAFFCLALFAVLGLFCLAHRIRFVVGLRLVAWRFLAVLLLNARRRLGAQIIRHGIIAHEPLVKGVVTQLANLAVYVAHHHQNRAVLLVHLCDYAHPDLVVIIVCERQVSHGGPLFDLCLIGLSHKPRIQKIRHPGLRILRLRNGASVYARVAQAKPHERRIPSCVGVARPSAIARVACMGSVLVDGVVAGAGAIAQLRARKSRQLA